MLPIISGREGDRIKIKVTVDLSGGMLEAEESILRAVNAVGNVVGHNATDDRAAVAAKSPASLRMCFLSSDWNRRAVLELVIAINRSRCRARCREGKADLETMGFPNTYVKLGGLGMR